MAIGDIATASTQRGVTLRRRQDLISTELQFAGERYWGVKDPISLRYFQLRDEEYFILQLLDGQTSLEEIVEAFEKQFAPRRLNLRQLHSFLGMLHRNALVLSDAPEQAEPLLARRDKQRMRDLGQTLSSLLSIRLRGIDPERFLNWLYPYCRWMFSPLSVAVVLMMAAAALLLVTVQYTTLRARLPEFHAFFSVANIAMIALTLAGIKALHELGHALCLKRFGGECHELGVMFLVFTPCLYCNVSDSWMLKSKWRRAAIGAAGIYVELFLASVCTFLWWFSEPGMLNAFCLNVMFISSVSTLLFNGNPLLRYDGYFILSDVAEAPNLAQQSDTLIRHGLAKWFLGVELVSERMLQTRRKWFLLIYGVASKIYRIFVVCAILWFVYQFLKPYGMQALAQLVSMVVIGGMVISPATRAVKFLSDPARRKDVNRPRMKYTLGALAAVVVLVCFVPLPYRLSAPALIQPQGAQRVYVSVPGRVMSAVEPGDIVSKGDLLATLENSQLARELAELQGTRDQRHLHVQNLERLRIDDPSASDQIPAAMEALADVEQRLKQRLLDQQQLFLRAPISGTVLPVRKPPRYPVERAQVEGELATWSGTPLDLENRGSYLDTGTPLCQVGDPQRLEALLVVDQADIKMVHAGQRVRLRFFSLPGEVFIGRVEKIAEIDLEIVPPELIDSGQLPMVTDENGERHVASTAYQALVSLDQGARPLLLSATGRAKIQAAPRSLGWRMLQYLARTFRFEL